MEGSPNNNSEIAKSREDSLKEMHDSGAFFSVNKYSGNIEVIATAKQKDEAKQEMNEEFISRERESAQKKREQLENFFRGYVPKTMTELSSPKFRATLRDLKSRFPDLEPEDYIGEANLGGNMGFVKVELKRYPEGVALRVEKM